MLAARRIFRQRAHALFSQLFQPGRISGAVTRDWKSHLLVNPLLFYSQTFLPLFWRPPLREFEMCNFFNAHLFGSFGEDVWPGYVLSFHGDSVFVQRQTSAAGTPRRGCEVRNYHGETHEAYLGRFLQNMQHGESNQPRPRVPAYLHVLANPAPAMPGLMLAD